MSAQVLFTNAIPTTPAEINNHQPDKLSEKKRREIKNAFRLAINKSRTRDEALRLTKLREKFFQPGGMTEDEAIIAWLEITTTTKAGTKPRDKHHVSAG